MTFFPQEIDNTLVQMSQCALQWVSRIKENGKWHAIPLIYYNVTFDKLDLLPVIKFINNNHPSRFRNSISLKKVSQRKVSTLGRDQNDNYY